MTENFDAYAEWLQIPADRRPPTHYDLLGLPEFESNSERIYEAAKERIAVLRRYQLGERAAEAMRLQKEVSQALECLKNPNSKQRYDEALHVAQGLPPEMSIGTPLSSADSPRPIVLPSPRPVLASRPPAARSPQPAKSASWMTSPQGIAVLATGFLFVLVIAGLGLRSVFMAGPTTAETPQLAEGTGDAKKETDGSSDGPSKGGSTTASKPIDRLAPLLVEGNRLADVLEGELPPSIDDILLAPEYRTSEDLRLLADKAEKKRSGLASDARLKELRRLIAKMDSERTRARDRAGKDVDQQDQPSEADGLKERFSDIESRLATSMTSSPELAAELEVLDELNQVQRSWARSGLSKATVSRAGQVVAQQKTSVHRGFAFLAACALLRENMLAEGARRGLLDASQTEYSDEERATLCQALLLSGDTPSMEEAIRRINREPQLLKHYNADDLMKSIETNKAVWQPARDALTAQLGSSNGSQLASIFGTADQPKPLPEKNPVTAVLPPFKPARGPGNWSIVLALPTGGSFSPKEVALERAEVDTIERNLPEHAFKYKKLVHCGWSINKKEGLSLDGWTVFRHENGALKLAAQFDYDDRKGPLRYWDADGKMRFFANYTADRLDGTACIFTDGLPNAILEYRGGQLKGKYVLDYTSGVPVALNVDGAASNLVDHFSAAEEEFKEVVKEIQKQELELKSYLTSAFKTAQRDYIAKLRKQQRIVSRAREKAMNRATEASIGRTINAMAVGAGAF